MKTFKMENGDLVFDGQNSLVMIEGKDEETQAMERILTTNKNEWFLNILHGLDCIKIQGKGVTSESVRLVITEAISQDVRVIDIEYIKVNIDNARRSLTVDFKVKTSTGNVIESQEVLEIG